MNLPDFAARCGWPPKEPVVRSRLLALDMLVTCRRCKGSGKYEQNPLDSRCYGCGGAGKKLPPLTARLAAHHSRATGTRRSRGLLRARATAARKQPMSRCEICQGPNDGTLMCKACGRAYDRAHRRDDGTIYAALVWAAKRARWYERRRAAKGRRGLP